MVNAQRTKNDRITFAKREIADRIREDNRNKNDEMTIERRNKSDHLREENRLKNDDMTDARRKANDRNPWRTFAMSLLVIAVLAVGAYYILTYYHIL